MISGSAVVLSAIPTVRVKPSKKRYVYYYVLQVDYGPQGVNDKYRTWVDIMETRDWGVVSKAKSEMKEYSDSDEGSLYRDELGQLEFRVIQRKVEMDTSEEKAM